MYIPFFRQIRHIGRLRAWTNAKLERRTWDDERYPPPPKMSYPAWVIFEGYRSEIYPSASHLTRWSRNDHRKNVSVERKMKRLYKRRQARQYRARHKNTGIY